MDLGVRRGIDHFEFATERWIVTGALLKDRFDREELLFVVWVDAGKTYILSLLFAVHPSAENQL